MSRRFLIGFIVSVVLILGLAAIMVYVGSIYEQDNNEEVK